MIVPKGYIFIPPSKISIGGRGCDGGYRGVCTQNAGAFQRRDSWLADLNIDWRLANQADSTSILSPNPLMTLRLRLYIQF